MAKTEREKMAAGEWYACVDDELDALRTAAQMAVFEHNSLPPTERGDIGPALRALLGSDGENAASKRRSIAPTASTSFSAGEPS